MDVLPAIGLLIIFIISIGTLQTIVNKPAPDSSNPRSDQCECDWSSMVVGISVP